MLLTLLLTGLLATQPPGDTESTRAEAERLARDGAHAEALLRFQELVAADPRDLEARTWIGHLHLRMGSAVRAEGVFRSVLAEDPDDVEALTGLGAALIGQDRLEEAILLMSRAEERDPDNPDVLAGLGRAHRAAGRTTLAVAYYSRADLIGGGRSDVRSGYEQIRRLHDHWIAVGGFGESFIRIPDTRAGDVSAGLRVSDRLRLLARGQAQQKFDRTEGRGGLGVEWRPRPRVRARAMGLYGPRTVVLPEMDAIGEVEVTHRRLVVIAGVQYIGFENGADVWVASPGAKVRLGEAFVAGARYSHSWTAFGPGGPRLGHRSGVIDGQLRLHPRLWAGVAYARNNESFDTLSPDRLGRFEADTTGASLRLDLRSLTSIAARYEYQRRAGQTGMIRVTTSLVQRF